MVTVLNGPWLLLGAVVLLGVAVRRGPRPRAAEVWVVASLMMCAAAARLLWGVWGPLHINGQGPLWIRGALDPEALAGYGPGYFELFSWVAHLGSAPDRSIFAVNVLLSALSPALLYTTARLAGVGRGGALAAALVLAGDAVTIRTAASEGYFSPVIALVLGVEASLALGVQAQRRGDSLAAGLALGAAGLLAAAVARIHPVAYLPLTLCPLLVLGAQDPDDWWTRAAYAAVAGLVIGATVVASSGETIIAALQAAPMLTHVFTGLAWPQGGLLLLLLTMVWLLRRWARPPWLPLLGVGSLLLMLVTRGSFGQHPLWELCYERLFWPGLLLGAAPLLPRRMQDWRWAVPTAAAAAVALMLPALPHLRTTTTEQLEYRFLQEALRNMPPGCTVAGVTRSGSRVWEIPSYLVPTHGFRAAGTWRAVDRVSDLDAAPADCLLYIRSSLCSSAEARALCESVERGIQLEPVASRLFSAAPSYTTLPYDRPEVEVVVFRVSGHEAASTGGPPAGHKGATTMDAPPALSDGAAITPAVAQALYERLARLHEPDGCRVVRLDTSQFRMTVDLQARSGAAHTLALATATGGNQAARRVGGWALASTPEFQRDCGATLVAIEHVLEEVAAPSRPSVLGNHLRARAADRSSLEHILLSASFVLLLWGTAFVLYRETRMHPPSPYALLTLALIWGAALVLRLGLSPRTFLHEYYHIAETLSGYLTGAAAPIYGETGPALFRLMGTVLGRPDDPQVIFLTNAVVSSLAIPAVALLDLELVGSWPQALCAAALLCVLPQHLRFSAGEDLFVQAVTFGMWTLALFMLYVRTRRLIDALLGALALALAMQTRPEMLFFPAVLIGLVLLAQPRAWRVLFSWRTLLAVLFVGILLVPRFLDLRQHLHDASSPPLKPPDLARYFRNLVLFQARVTPPVYWILLLVGLVWGIRHRLGVHAWVIAVFVGYTLFSHSLFDNPPYDLRSQILPTSFAVLIAAGSASVWMEAWGRHRRRALGVGAAALLVLAATVVVARQGFVTELRDQQLEWAFLERTVPRLPQHLRLLSASGIGGRNLDAFPEFLLSRAGKTYEIVDVRRTATGDLAWPPAGEDLLYYQGMFCYFAFFDEPAPDRMSGPCTAVHERYVAEPLFIEDLRTTGYSWLRYTDGPFRIGFFRLRAAR